MPVGNADVHGIPLGVTGRLGARPGPVLRVDGLPASRGEARCLTPDLTGTEVERRRLADKSAPASRVVARQQLADRNSYEVGIAVPRLAIGECELRALGDEMNVVGGQKRDLGGIDSLEQPKLLKKDRALAPRPAFGDRPRAEVDGQRRLTRGFVRIEIGGAQQARMRFARAVHRRRRAMALDRFGDETRVESTQGSLDLDFAAACPGLLDKPPVGRGQVRVAQSHAGAGHAVCEIDRGRCRPVVSKERLDGRDHLRGSGKQRMARTRIADGELENVAQVPRAMVAQERQPRAQAAGDASCDGPRARDVLEAHRADLFDGRRLRRRALAAYDLDLSDGRIPKDDRDLASQSVEVRFDDLQDESGGDSGVECVSTPLEHRHRALRGEPVRRADYAERALDERSGSELHQRQRPMVTLLEGNRWPRPRGGSLSGVPGARAR